MGFPFVRIGWNKYETALLIDAYERVVSGEVSRKEAVRMLSERLRNRMLLNGIEVSDTYRNENGIAMQMSAIEYCMTDGEKGFENPSKMFVDVANLALEDRTTFELLLKEALSLYPEPVTHIANEPKQELLFDFVREAESSDSYKRIIKSKVFKGLSFKIFHRVKMLSSFLSGLYRQRISKV